jgi:hypothetical protein
MCAPFYAFIFFPPFFSYIISLFIYSFVSFPSQYPLSLIEHVMTCDSIIIPYIDLLVNPIQPEDDFTIHVLLEHKQMQACMINFIELTTMNSGFLWNVLGNYNMV